MDRPNRVRAGQLLLFLYSMECAAILVAVGVYKASTPAELFTLSKPAALSAGGLLAFVGALRFLVAELHSAGSLRRTAFAVALAVNLASLLLMAVFVESAMRLAARETSRGIEIGTTVLRPTWAELVEQSREVLDRVRPWDSWDSSYFVFDEELGWTVGPNRQTEDGLYFSTGGGIRSAAPGASYDEGFAGPSIAIIGDSNAFSFEVPFEESWGFHLQEILGGGVQVLNFGVDGYGLDQILLRYERDVRPWKPEVVVLGLIGHDLERSMAVYPFLSFGWPGYINKPRLIVTGENLEPLNVPLPDPMEILNANSIHELPGVEHDLGYRTMDWRGSRQGLPMSLRFLMSRFPHWPMPDPAFSDEAIKELNTRIMLRLMEGIAHDEAEAVVVLMSDRRDRLDALAGEMLNDAGIPFQRVVDCLATIPLEERQVASGNHFSGKANRLIAECTSPTIERALLR